MITTPPQPKDQTTLNPVTLPAQLQKEDAGARNSANLPDFDGVQCKEEEGQESKKRLARKQHHLGPAAASGWRACPAQAGSGRGPLPGTSTVKVQQNRHTVLQVGWTHLQKVEASQTGGGLPTDATTALPGDSAKDGIPDTLGRPLRTKKDNRDNRENHASFLLAGNLSLLFLFSA